MSIGKTYVSGAHPRPDLEQSNFCHGEPLSVGTDGNGGTLEVCRVCGSRPQRLIGTRAHDQRKRFEAELAERVRTASTNRKPGAKHVPGKRCGPIAVGKYGPNA